MEFLLSARDRRGWWRDFDTLAGPSDEWVTAYVGVALSCLPGPRAKAAAGDAWGLLSKSRWFSPGWGYNRWVPADADSTAWALRLAERVGADGSRRSRRARRFLAEHLRPGGGLATYAAGGPIRRFTRLKKDISFDGWCGAHTCVTAAAAALCGFEARGELLDHLRRTRDEDGGWTGYWWCGRAYPTALAVESLADPAAPLSSAIEATIKWACENAAARPDDSPSAFDLAGYLTILCFAKDGEAAAVSRELIKTIYKLQLPDGSWPPSAAMRIPPPYVTDPESYHDWVYGGRGGGSILLDGRGIYTTATVVKALQLAKMLAEKPA